MDGIITDGTKLPYQMKIFACSSNPILAEAVCKAVGVQKSPIQINRFADGEIGVQILENVRGCDTFVVQSSCTPVNDHLMEMFLIIDALKRASAKRITAVIPYYGYARQDRKTKPRVPISAALVARLIESAGADRVLSVDLHCGQIQGFFRIPVDNLYAQPVICREAIELLRGLTNITVVSPDAGGVERADVFRSFLTKALGVDVGMAVMNKQRLEANKVHKMELVGQVKGRDCVIVDDMIDTAGTLVAAAEALKEGGAQRIFACATHALLNEPAKDRIAASPIEKVLITDTIPMKPSNIHEKFVVVSIAKLIGDAIKCVHDEQSINSLFK